MKRINLIFLLLVIFCMLLTSCGSRNTERDIWVGSISYDNTEAAFELHVQLSQEMPDKMLSSVSTHINGTMYIAERGNRTYSAVMKSIKADISAGDEVLSYDSSKTYTDEKDIMCSLAYSSLLDNTVDIVFNSEDGSVSSFDGYENIVKTLIEKASEFGSNVSSQALESLDEYFSQERYTYIVSQMIGCLPDANKHKGEQWLLSFYELPPYYYNINNNVTYIGINKGSHTFSISGEIETSNDLEFPKTQPLYLLQGTLTGDISVTEVGRSGHIQETVSGSCSYYSSGNEKEVPISISTSLSYSVSKVN